MKGGYLIKEARKRAGLTQRELAERLGTSQSVIARWESNKRSPTMETVTRALRACGLDLVVSLATLDDHDLVLAARQRSLIPEERLQGVKDALGVEEWARRAERADA